MLWMLSLQCFFLFLQWNGSCCNRTLCPLFRDVNCVECEVYYVKLLTVIHEVNKRLTKICGLYILHRHTAVVHLLVELLNVCLHSCLATELLPNSQPAPLLLLLPPVCFSAWLLLERQPLLCLNPTSPKVSLRELSHVAPLGSREIIPECSRRRKD